MNYEVNKLNFDEFGRPNGILAINKPAGMTSHDVVAQIRRILSTPKVGHAGALDPFADGLLIILVGKATKESDSFLNMDKSYTATILLGIKTTSADPEGEVINVEANTQVPSNIQDILNSFMPEYEQYVPVFSSVKYQGEKLRVLARSAEHWEITDENGVKTFKFTRRGKSGSIPLPKHLCKIYSIEALEQGKIDLAETDFYNKNQPQLNDAKYNSLRINVSCSKGTYIRALAEDIATRFSPPAPAILWNLTRTQIGDIAISQSLKIEEVESLKKF